MSGQRTQWNEATRVQMPALVHLTRIGFTYFGKITEDKAGTVYDPDTNILIEVFKSQFAKLNPERAGEAEAMLRIIRQELDNDDIGESFYKRLKSVSPVRLIDFEHPENNTFHCSAEFTCKRDEDEFRPDITLFVNGLPLVFIEVKKPNNIGGMVAEAERMNKLRFPNKKFRRFINITQLMIFSNNMEYDAMGGIVPIQGVFYCTGSKKGSPFNCFREENPQNLNVAPYNRDFPYKDIDPEVEKQILSDFNNQVIHTSPEYQTNLQTTTPTNRVLTSMCSPDRLLFLLKYGITYYHKTKELDDGTIEQIDQKHIMRYQQFFAAMIVRERISEGTTSGIIWHTQGSGKTALSFHLSYVLTDYFASINKVTKFYFIVDRLDLMLSSTGMRVGEMVRLNRDDIRFDERECVVFSKGDKERIVYFDARTKIHLQNYLQSRTDSDPALFVSLQSPHRRLTIGGIELRLRELGKRLDIPKVHPHKFRRTLATMAMV